MKKKLLNLFMSLVLFFPCVILFNACGKDDVGSVLKSLIIEMSDKGYSIKDNVITLAYGEKYTFSSDDFKVTGKYDDETSKVVAKKSDKKDGFTFVSNIPTDQEITPAGDYKITFSYGEKIKIEITVKVVKSTINMDNVDWNYTNYFTYDGSEKEVKIVNLPAGVTVEYTGVTKTKEVGVHSAVAKFSHINGENYEPIPDKEITWEIKKGKINVTSVAFKDKTYSGREQSVEILNNDNLSALGVQVKSITGTTTAINSGRYNIVVNFEHIDEAERNNYVIDSLSTTWSIAKKDLIVAANDHEIIYGDTPSNNGVEYSGFVTGEDEGDLENSLAFDYGSYAIGSKCQAYPITPKGLTSNNYNIIFVSGELTVTPKALTITANSHEVTYGYTGDGYNGLTFDGLVLPSDATSLKGTLNVNVYNSSSQFTGNVGEYTIELSGLTSENYNISFVNGILKVNQKDLVITADSREITYGDELAHTVTYSGFVKDEDEDVLTGELEILCDCNGDAGSYDIVPSGLSSENYNISYVNGKLTINKKTISVTPKKIVIDYGTKVTDIQNNGVDVVGLINGDTVATLGEITFNYSYKDEDVAGKYKITIDITAHKNYIVVCNAGELIVTQVTIDKSGIKLVNDELKYTGDNLLSLIKVDESTLPNNEIYVKEINIKDNLDPIEIGDYIAIISLECDDTEKYGEISDLLLPFSIVKGDIDVSALSLVKNSFSYSGTDIEVEINMPRGTEIQSISNNKKKDVGNYDVVFTLVCADSEHYNDFENEFTMSWSITAIPLEITVNSHEITYGDTFTNGFTCIGFVNNETISVLAGTPVYEITNSNGVYSGNVGEYTISLNGLTSNNYLITKNNGTLVVNKKEISVTTKTITIPYGTNKDTIVVEYDVVGLVNGNTVNDLNLDYSVSYNTGDDAGEYEINITAGDNSNYSITCNKGLLIVTPTEIDVEAIALEKNEFKYTGSSIANSLVVNLDTIPSGVIIAKTEIKENATPIEVGTYYLICYLQVVDNVNTTVPETIELSFSIIKGDFEVSSLSLIKDTFSYTGKEITVEVDLPDNTQIKEIVSNQHKDVGEYDAIVTIICSDTTHYNEYEKTFVIHWSIEPIALEITANSHEITYGETFTNGYTCSGFVNDETISVLNGSPIYTISNPTETYSGNAGEYEISISGFTSNNYTIDFKPGTLIVNKKDITITPKTITIPFGTDKNAIEMNVDIVGLVDGDKSDDFEIEYTCNYETGDNVGNYDIEINVVENRNYNITCNKGVLTITPLTIDASIIALEKDNFKYTGASFESQLVVDTMTIPEGVSIVRTEIKDDKTPVEVGDYYFVCYLEVEDSVNYIVPEFVEIPFSIDKNDIDLSDVSLKQNTFVYTGQSIEVELNLPGGVEITSIQNNVYKNAGEYLLIVTLSCSDTTHFNDFSETKKFPWCITPAPLTIKVHDNEITYGDNLVDGGYTPIGLVNGESLNVIDGEAVYSYSKNDTTYTGDVGTYDIMISGLYSQNYDITYIKGTLTVKTQKIDVSLVSFGSVNELDYIGEEITPTIVNVPENVNVSYVYYDSERVESSPVDDGDYIAIATLTPTNSNFELVGNLVIEFEYTIVKAISSNVTAITFNLLDFNNTSGYEEVSAVRYTPANTSFDNFSITLDNKVITDIVVETVDGMSTKLVADQEGTALNLKNCPTSFYIAVSDGNEIIEYFPVKVIYRVTDYSLPAKTLIIDGETTNEHNGDGGYYSLSLMSSKNISITILYQDLATTNPLTEEPISLMDKVNNIQVLVKIEYKGVKYSISCVCVVYCP